MIPAPAAAARNTNIAADDKQTYETDFTDRMPDTGYPVSFLLYGHCAVCRDHC